MWKNSWNYMRMKWIQVSFCTNVHTWRKRWIKSCMIANDVFCTFISCGYSALMLICRGLNKIKDPHWSQAEMHIFLRISLGNCFISNWYYHIIKLIFCIFGFILQIYGLQKWNHKKSSSWTLDSIWLPSEKILSELLLYIKGHS